MGGAEGIGKVGYNSNPGDESVNSITPTVPTVSIRVQKPNSNPGLPDKTGAFYV